MQAVSPSPSELDRVGRLTLIAVVAAGLSSSVLMNEAALAAPENLGILALGALFLVCLLVLGDSLDRAANPARIGYFLLQLSLAAAVFLLQARLDSFGMAWIILMPLLVQGMFVWSWPGMTTLCLATLLLPVLHVRVLAGWGSAMEVAIGVAAGITFVLLFSAMTVREARARRESERLGRELADANRRLAELAVHSGELAAARERNRLAREIHDSVGHGLTVASVQIGAARIHLQRDEGATRAALDKAASAIRQGLAELRSSVGSLRAGPLEDRDVPRAVEDLVRELGDLESDFRVLGAPRPLQPDLSLTLFRIAQEGLTNVRRHSEARRLRVTLDYRFRNRVILEMVNDGVVDTPGDDRAATGGFGLLGLRERVALHGGELRAEPYEQRSFLLRAEVPS